MVKSMTPAAYVAEDDLVSHQWEERPLISTIRKALYDAGLFLNDRMNVRKSGTTSIVEMSYNWMFYGVIYISMMLV